MMDTCLMRSAGSRTLRMSGAWRAVRVALVSVLAGPAVVHGYADSRAVQIAPFVSVQISEETDEPLRKLRPGGDSGSAADGARGSDASASPAQAPPAGGTDPSAGSAQPRSNTASRDGDELAAARRMVESGKLLEARTTLATLLRRSVNEAESTAIRDLLGRIADVAIFSPRLVDGDTLVEVYTVQSGDRLARVARKYDVPYEIILRINGISDAGRISVGQRLKIPRGPFHARISKSQYRLDLYLQDVFVRSYRVGLGKENGTPTGEWRVRDRIANPTYYPPESATDRRVIAADDPSNPLGEYWIALEGVSGDAVGKRGFGIHGTIEPQSIGKSESMGCVRMLNDDVAWVFSALQPGKSTVTIVP